VLIVNADDWGLRPEVTDGIAECWSAGAVTCASAMVHMADSARAFEIAAADGVPLGLHINLTTVFTAASAVPDESLRQRRAVTYFTARGYRRFGFDPLVRRLLDECVADQLDAFLRQRGAGAVHADGHQHIHVCPTVLSTGSIGRVRSLRRAHGFVPESPLPKRLYRRAINGYVRSRFRSVPFASLRDLHPTLGGIGLDGLARIARERDVEVMVHPAWEDERAILLSSEWGRFLRGVPTGSHADLS